MENNLDRKKTEAAPPDDPDGPARKFNTELALLASTTANTVVRTAEFLHRLFFRT